MKIKAKKSKVKYKTRKLILYYKKKVVGMVVISLKNGRGNITKLTNNIKNGVQMGTLPLKGEVPMPSKSLKKKKKRKKEHPSNSNFQLFWDIYPKKRGKQGARSAWNTHKNKMPPIDDLLDIISAQKQSEHWGKGFIPNPQSWINQHRWEDEFDDLIKPRRESTINIGLQGRREECLDE